MQKKTNKQHSSTYLEVQHTTGVTSSSQPSRISQPVPVPRNIFIPKTESKDPPVPTPRIRLTKSDSPMMAHTQTPEECVSIVSRQASLECEESQQSHLSGPPLSENPSPKRGHAGVMAMLAAQAAQVTLRKQHATESNS